MPHVVYYLIVRLRTMPYVVAMPIVFCGVVIFTSIAMSRKYRTLATLYFPYTDGLVFTLYFQVTLYFYDSVGLVF